MEDVTVRRNGLAQEAHKYLDEHGYPPLEDNDHSEVQPDVMGDSFDPGTSHVDVALQSRDQQSERQLRSRAADGDLKAAVLACWTD